MQSAAYTSNRNLKEKNVSNNLLRITIFSIKRLYVQQNIQPKLFILTTNWVYLSSTLMLMFVFSKYINTFQLCDNKKVVKRTQNKLRREAFNFFL